MTKEQQNQIIKDAWVRALQKENDIPENIGNIYKNWLLGKIKQASDQLKQPAQPEGDQQQQQQEEQSA
jgi:hypothetical protein